jgi:hypothetical protein
MHTTATTANANTRDSAAPVASASSATTDSDSAAAASAASTQPRSRGAEEEEDEDDNDNDDDDNEDVVAGASAANAHRDRVRIHDDGSNTSPSPLLAASQRAVCELVAGAEFRLTLGYLYAAPVKCKKHTLARTHTQNIAISPSLFSFRFRAIIVYSPLVLYVFNWRLAWRCIFPQRCH